MGLGTAGMYWRNFKSLRDSIKRDEEYMKKKRLEEEEKKNTASPEKDSSKPDTSAPARFWRAKR